MSEKNSIVLSYVDRYYIQNGKQKVKNILKTMLYLSKRKRTNEDEKNRFGRAFNRI